MIYNFTGSKSVINQQLSGAAEARRAHNPEGNGSKPFSAITFVFVWQQVSSLLPLTHTESRSATHKSQKVSWKLDLMLTTRYPGKHSIPSRDVLIFSFQSSTLDITCNVTEKGTSSCNASYRTVLQSQVMKAVMFPMHSKVVVILVTTFM
jgi:hypothetical protein